MIKYFDNGEEYGYIEYREDHILIYYLSSDNNIVIKLKKAS